MIKLKILVAFFCSRDHHYLEYKIIPVYSPNILAPLIVGLDECNRVLLMATYQSSLLLPGSVTGPHRGVCHLIGVVLQINAHCG